MSGRIKSDVFLVGRVNLMQARMQSIVSFPVALFHECKQGVEEN